MAEKVRYGIIGCGLMGHEHLRNLSLFEDCVVTDIFEPDEQMRASAKQQVPQARFHDSVAQLLEGCEADCLLIASPNHCHAGQVEEIARTRPLPLLVEKPLCTSIGDVANLASVCKDYPAPLWVGMEYRFMPPLARFLQEAHDATGDIAMLTMMEHRRPFLSKVGNWNRFNSGSGGTFVEKCCHFFDLMRHTLRADPIRVMASAGQAYNHLDEDYDGKKPDILDHGYVVVEFDSGAKAMLELCMFAEGAEYQEVFSAVGPKGKIECLVPGPSRFWPDDLPEPVPKVVISPRDPKRPQEIEVPVDTDLLVAGDHNGSTFYQHKKFLEAVRGNQEVEVTWQDGLYAVMMGMAAQKSAIEGKAVDFEKFKSAVCPSLTD